MRNQANETPNVKTVNRKKSVGILAALFGCWHQDLSRPFTNVEESYRVCLNCGARRSFNPKTMQTFGRYYFSPIAPNAIKADRE